MTSKELSYVEDALGHEEFMKSCSAKISAQLNDPILSQYLNQLGRTHTDIFNKFLNLL